MALPAEVAKVLCPCADCSEQRPPLTVFLIRKAFGEPCSSWQSRHGSTLPRAEVVHEEAGL